MPAQLMNLTELRSRLVPARWRTARLCVASVRFVCRVCGVTLFDSGSGHCYWVERMFLCRLSKDDDEGQGRRLTGLWARDAESAEGGRVSGQGLHLRRGHAQFLATLLAHILGPLLLSGHLEHGGGLLLGGVGVRGGKSEERNEPIPDILVDEVVV
ncbi:hypothetical protein DFH09DRAFT_1454566 [Mycena vulgaris]|nr:hypothetical protein DFH09DRAFT_1454566 [Mycena vulgaris]